MGLRSDSAAQRLSIPNSPVLDGITAMSFWGWFRVSTGYTAGRLFALAPEGAGGGQQFMLDGGVGALDCFFNGGGARTSVTGSFPLDEPVFLAWAKGAGATAPRMYVGTRDTVVSEVAYSGAGTAAAVTPLTGPVANLFNYPGFDIGPAGVEAFLVGFIDQELTLRDFVAHQYALRPLRDDYVIFGHVGYGGADLLDWSGNRHAGSAVGLATVSHGALPRVLRGARAAPLPATAAAATPVNASAVVAAESLGHSAVLVTSGLEAQSARAGAAVAPFEAQSARAGAAVAPFETQSAAASAAVAPFEASEGIRQTEAVPHEAAGRNVVTSVAGTGYEAAGTTRAGAAVGQEALRIAAAAEAAALAWLHAVETVAILPAETLGRMAPSRTAGWEARSPVRVAATPPFEAVVGRIGNAVTTPVEALAGVVDAQAAPWESEASGIIPIPHPDHIHHAAAAPRTHVSPARRRTHEAAVASRTHNAE